MILQQDPQETPWCRRPFSLEGSWYGSLGYPEAFQGPRQSLNKALTWNHTVLDSGLQRPEGR